ncbi:MAG: periplasmic heavy metal sensor [Alphaproteobacteria bacterium]|nr:periplasmic heavy metal sensor [Alphaproteobacteria bacterium]
MSVTAAGLPRARQPRNRVLAALLAVSVALNLCALAGAAWTRLNAPPAPPTAGERFQRLAAALDLTPAQRPAFDAYAQAMIGRGERMRQEVEPALDAAWKEVAKPDADQARVMQLLDQAGDRRRAFQHEALSATFGLLATLSPGQREKFVAAERSFHAAQRRRRGEEAR